MSETLQTIIAKIQKLRELGKNNTNPNEASAAARAADALIEKYQLVAADLEIKGQQAEPIEIIKESLYESGRVMLWVHNLATVLCDHYGCTYYVDTVEDFVKVAAKNPNARRTTFKALRMVGRRSDTEIVKYMFAWLQDEIARITKTNAYGQGMRYSQNYACGVVNGIKLQLNAERKSATEEANRAGQSAAMVMVSNRSKEAEKFMRSAIRLGSSGRSHLYKDEDAFSQGTEVGKRLHLNKGIEASSPNKTLK